MDNNDFLNIGFIGFGLIGGSIAKAIKAAHPDYNIIVASRSQKPLEAAFNDKVIDVICTEADEHFSICDYIFLCTPVVTITKYMSTLKPVIKPGCILTDVGSVKGNIHKTAHELGLDNCFIGGHPMAGSELSGYANSSADILKDAKYVITPTDKTSEESLNSYAALIKDMGAVPVIMDYKEHDYTVAAISHVPHLIAAGLTHTVENNDDDKKHMHLLAASGFRDTTRIAASSPEMWEQICDANKDAICTFLGKFIDEMQVIKNNIENSSPKDTSTFIENLFKDAGSYRKSF